MRRKLLLGGCAFLIVLAGWWLFRSEAEAYPPGGRRWLRYSFGWPSVLATDMDLNGLAEAKLEFSFGSSDYLKGSGEYFEDWDQDGQWDLRARMVDGYMVWIQLSTERSKPFLFGKEAQTYLASHPARFKLGHGKR